jgi:hypothetical protein
MCAVTGAACMFECVRGTAVLTQIDTNKITMCILVAIDTNYKEECNLVILMMTMTMMKIMTRNECTAFSTLIFRRLTTTEVHCQQFA